LAIQRFFLSGGVLGLKGALSLFVSLVERLLVKRLLSAVAGFVVLAERLQVDVFGALLGFNNLVVAVFFEIAFWSERPKVLIRVSYLRSLDLPAFSPACLAGLLSLFLAGPSLDGLGLPPRPPLALPLWGLLLMCFAIPNYCNLNK
jgi:hypothetical protein